MKYGDQPVILEPVHDREGAELLASLENSSGLVSEEVMALAILLSKL